MKLVDVLSVISNTASELNLATPYICGGVPRDKLLNKLNDFSDVDITTGNKDIDILSKEVSRRLSGPNVFYKQMSDHSMILYNDLKIDFSSNYNTNDIANILNKSGIKPNNMLCELYSRDFTCNGLLMSMDLKKIYDPSGLGINDLKSRVINTFLPPSISLGDVSTSNNNKRIIRVLYMACKLNFKVSDEIIEWVSNNPKLVANCSQQYLSKKLISSLKYNKQYAIALINKMGLMPYLPPVPGIEKDMLSISSASSHRKNIKLAILRDNYTNTCPYGLSIDDACRSSGNLTDKMTALIKVPDDIKDYTAEKNNSLLVLNKTKHSCKYAGHLIDGSDMVQCNWMEIDSGQGSDVPLKGSEVYSKNNAESSLDGLFTMPDNSYTYNMSEIPSYYGIMQPTSHASENANSDVKKAVGGKIKQ